MITYSAQMGQPEPCKGERCPLATAKIGQQIYHSTCLYVCVCVFAHPLLLLDDTCIYKCLPSVIIS